MGYTLDGAKLQVGPGWHGLIEKLYKAGGSGLEVFGIKEKFGYLSINVWAPDARVMQLATTLEEESKYICESCGRAKSKVILKNHWYHSLCEDCLEITRDGKLWYGEI